MQSSKQKEAFLNYEANAWFNRNKAAILEYNDRKDLVIDLIKKYNLDPQNILEIGCSAGYRLNGLKNVFPHSCCYGIEPSDEAISFGKSRYPDINLDIGSADNLSKYESGKMDIVIVGFVFYVVDRDILFKVVAEINRVLKNGGILIILDFFSEIPRKNSYHHIDEFEAYCYKQNYQEIFKSSNLYFELDKFSWHHTNKSFDSSNNYHDKCFISMLKKDTDAGYR